MIQIGSTKIQGYAVLAPMAGITDIPFRIIAREQGASMTYTELVSADGLVYDREKTRQLMEFTDRERPIAIQLFGHDPDKMARGAVAASELNPDFIDLNYGCPAKKVVRRGAGAALMRDLKLFEEIARAVIEAVDVPVTGKIRSGWDTDSIVAGEAAQILESSGAAAVAVHARTRKQGFAGQADWEIIKTVKESVSIPVIGNGDIYSPDDGLNMRQMTGCDLVMVGRGVLGRPWLLAQVNNSIEGRESAADPDACQKIDVCLEHYRLAVAHTGVPRGVREMRKHIGWYLKGMRGSHRVKQEVFVMDDPEAVIQRLQQFAMEFTNQYSAEW